MAEPARKEQVFEGLAVAPGIAIGRAYVYEATFIAVPEYTVPPEAKPSELARFEAAIERSRSQVLKLKGSVDGRGTAAAEEMGYLLDAHLAMLSGSRLIRGVRERIEVQCLNAEAAVYAEINTILATFAAMSDSYLSGRGDDIRDVGNRLLRNLTATPYLPLRRVQPGSIIIAEDLTPADTAQMDPDRTAGLATVVGGIQGHTAIMARSMNLPAVIGAEGLVGTVRTNDMVVLDGNAGCVVINPEPATRLIFDQARHRLARLRPRLDALRDQPAVTRDGVTLDLQANIELPRELKGVLACGAGGVGLLRSEFLFLNRTDLPDQEEQFGIYRRMVEGLNGRELTIRTLDLGGEKLARALHIRYPPGPNPALGLRAVRLVLRERQLLRDQLAACLRASAFGPVRILVPMITCVHEMRTVRAEMLRIARQLRRQGIAIGHPLPPLGAMIEVPGAALSADAIAAESDFLSLGTNDLTMYTLAIDRGDERLSHLADPLHPAVIRLIHFTAEAGARAGIPVAVCGEMAGVPHYTALLIGFGIRHLSAATPSVPRVKERIRAIDAGAARNLARQVLDQTDPARISALLDCFNSEMTGRNR